MKIDNPRVLWWLKAVGLTPSAIAKPAGADTPVIEVNGEKNVWTVHYMSWVGEQWTAWAKTKGFEGHKGGHYAHERAQAAGHADFDAWLKVNYET